jgi:hypothetical protein
MKKFESLGRSLTKAEQRNIKGGGDDPNGYANYGKCSHQVGCWHYIQSVSWQTCLTDLGIYCADGQGTCSINPLCN